MRTFLFATLTLVVGFALGWISRSVRHAAASPEAEPVAKLSAAHAPTSALPPSSPSSAPLPMAGAAGMNPESYRNRLQTIRLLRRSGATVLFGVLAGDRFSPAFGKILDLTPEEMARLNDVVLDTKSELDAARGARATPRTSEDGKTFIVDVPAADVATSRAAYDRLLGTLKSTLGSERYELFNELGGEAFERGFDQFGLNTVRYELSLEPKPFIGETTPYYEYKRHYLDPTGAGKGWSGSTQNLAQIEKDDPILARFLKSKLASSAGK